MPKEVQTDELLKHSFASGKQVFIPKIIGPNAEDMLMLELKSYEDIDRFPKNNWGIPEPVIDVEVARHAEIVPVDLVIVPGVGFDSHCQRLGHGKGSSMKTTAWRS